MMGSEHFDTDFASSHSAELAAWGESLSTDADIMVYGSNLASSADGQALVHTLANATGADVAASDDITGSNGDWNLEYSSGLIETSMLTVDELNHNMTNHAITDFGDDGAEGQLRSILSEISAGESISFISSDADVGGIITLAQGQLVINSYNITINGMTGDANVTVDAAEESRHFYVNPDASVNLTNLNLVNGHAGAGNDGGSVYVASNAAATISNVVFNNAIDGETSTDGVAVYNDGIVQYDNVSVSGYAQLTELSTNEVAFVIRWVTILLMLWRNLRPKA